MEQIKLSFKQKLFYFFYSRKSITGLVFLLVALFLGKDIYSGLDFLALRIPDNAPVTTGVVLNSWYWGVGSEGNDLHGTDYMYQNPNGTEMYYWTSFTRFPLGIGSTVVVEYVEDEPTISRIKGETNTAFSIMSMVGFVFCAFLSLVMFYVAFVTPFKHLRILKKGLVTRAEQVKRVKTSLTRKNDPLYKFLFKFTTKSGEEVSVTINSVNVKELSDEKREILIYNPRNPKQVLLADDMPGFIGKEIRKQAKEILN